MESGNVRRGSPWGWISLTICTLAFFISFTPMKIPTSAMEKTFLAGDQVLITNNFTDAPSRRDVVVFRYPIDPKQTFIRRVLGVPGDRIRIANKQLFVNGAAQTEPFAQHSTTYIDAYRDNFPSDPQMHLFKPGEEMLALHVTGGEVVVPEGKYFVLGDNRDVSLDSRYWGFVDRKDIIGRPFMIYLSVEPLANRGDENAVSIALTRVRWDRLFRRPG